MTFLLFLVLLYLPLLWFLIRALRCPRDAALWMVVACLALRTADAPGVVPAVRAATDPAVAQWVKDTMLTGSWTALLLFFVIAAGGSRRRVRREIAGWVALSVVVAVCTALTPAWWAAPNLLAQPDPPVAFVVAIALVDVYYVYVTGSCALWGLRYAAESQRRLRPGLWLASAGLGVFALGSVVALAIDVGLLPGALYDAVLPAVLGYSVVVFAAGVCVVGMTGRIVALQVWLRHRHRSRVLQPLWEALDTAYPSNALDRAGGGWWFDRLLPRRVHRRYWRRRTEVRDGLVQLSPHLADAGYDPGLPAHEQRQVFREALASAASGRDASTSRAVPVAVPPEGSSADDDVVELLRLAEALRDDAPALRGTVR